MVSCFDGVYNIEIKLIKTINKIIGQKITCLERQKWYETIEVYDNSSDFW